MENGQYFVFILLINVTMLFCDVKAMIENGNLCNYDYDMTPEERSLNMSSLNEAKVFMLNTSSGDNCMCTLNSYVPDNYIDLNMELLSYSDEDCTALTMLLRDHTFYSCPHIGGSTRLQLDTLGQISVGIYNPQNVVISASIILTSTYPNLAISCTVQDSVVEKSNCPCSKMQENIGVLYSHHEVPVSRRLLIGFMAALAFLICVGIILLFIFLINRGYIDVPQKCQKSEEKKIDDPYHNIDTPVAFAHNLAYVEDTVPPPTTSGITRTLPSYDFKTPIKSIDGIYATIDLSTNQNAKLPFTPDTNLKLDLRTPDEMDACSKYRGSLDSGLYSELSTDKQSNLSKNAPNLSFNTGPYATSMDTLQSLGPDHTFEPPADQSSPKLKPKTKEELDLLYAKPIKRKKKSSKAKSSAENLPTQISINELPEYHPQPISSRPGSSNNVHSGINRSGSNNGVNFNPYSRSENELYLTDTGNESYGSRGTVSTDV